MKNPLSTIQIKKYKKYSYIDEGSGKPLVLLHGLFGSLSNFEHLIDHFKKHVRVIVPILPLYELDLFHTSVTGLQKYVHKFLHRLDIQNPILLGNSLGGHIALQQAIAHPLDVKMLILTGSSGLFEHGMGDTYPKRNSYEFVRMKTQATFYDPKVATKELVDDVFEIVNNRKKIIKILYLARSAIKNNLGHELSNIYIPTLLIWGKNDIITPPFVAKEFKKKMPNSELHLINKCGHAPMMETPFEFNKILFKYLSKKKMVK